MASLADASLDVGAGDFVNARFLCPSSISDGLPFC
jgi:hypothetical protein